MVSFPFILSPNVDIKGISAKDKKRQLAAYGLGFNHIGTQDADVFERTVVSVGLYGLNSFDHLQSGLDASENGILAVEPRAISVTNEKLAVGRIRHH